MTQPYRFIDLFAGIGGFHCAFHAVGAECVFASEIDRHARKTYEHNFRGIAPKLFDGGFFNDDILKVEPQSIPDFDILCAGFPCQPFSVAGLQKGFDDERGHMFFRIRDILQAKRPRAFFLENVPNLLKHNDGKTFKEMVRILTHDLGYTIFWHAVKASDYGVPQSRKRLFIVGFSPHYYFVPPPTIPLTLTMSDILGGACEKKIGYTLRVGGRGSPIGDRRNWDGYIVDGEEVRLTPQMGLRMQGFPDWFELPVSDTQAMKQLGNSVAVPAIQAYEHEIIKKLNLGRVINELAGRAYQRVRG